MIDSARPVMLIAGGSGSIGSVIAAHAVAAGWRVALHGSSEDSVAIVMNRLSLAADPNHRGFVANFAEAGAVIKLVATVGEWSDRIDAIVDCSTASAPLGNRSLGPFADTDPLGYTSVLELSVATLQRLSHAALPWLQRKGGTIVAFASDAGRFAAPRQAIIGTSRAAIMGFVRNLAVEVARDQVRVNCISPSFVDETETARRLADNDHSRLERARHRAGLGLPTPDDIAPLVLFLCSPDARCITGQVISVNGGLNA